MLAVTWNGLPWTARLASVGVCMTCTASNWWYLRKHRVATIGMIPVALFSLLPAVMAAWRCERLPLCLRIACAGASVLLGLALALFCWWFVRLRRTYARHPDIDSDAALIVLGGAIKHGRPCSTLARRLDVAARLWHEAPARTVVVTGGPTPDRRTTEANEMARYLREHGVSASSIVLEPTARNTSENIACSLELLGQRGIGGQRCVVSSDYHLWRAVRDGRALGAELTPVPAPTPTTSVPQQWCREVLTILARR